MKGTEGSRARPCLAPSSSSQPETVTLSACLLAAPQSHPQTCSVGGMRLKECRVWSPESRKKTKDPHWTYRYQILFGGPLPSALSPRTAEQGTLSILRGAQGQVPGWQEAARASLDGPETAVGQSPGVGQAGPCGGLPASCAGRGPSQAEATPSLPREPPCPTPEPQPGPAPLGDECWARSRGSLTLCPPPARRRGPQPCSRLSLGCTTV